jgi:peptidoglycan/LPS O-acetylase OafA/YrhL
VRYSIQAIALVPIIYAAVVFPHSRMFRALSWKPLVHIGVLSYTLYLSHEVVLGAIGQHVHWSRVATGLVAFPITVVFAEVMRVLVEQPAARFRRRIAGT